MRGVTSIVQKCDLSLTGAEYLQQGADQARLEDGHARLQDQLHRLGDDLGLLEHVGHLPQQACYVAPLRAAGHMQEVSVMPAVEAAFVL